MPGCGETDREGRKRRRKRREILGRLQDALAHLMPQREENREARIFELGPSRLHFRGLSHSLSLTLLSPWVEASTNIGTSGRISSLLPSFPRCQTRVLSFIHEIVGPRPYSPRLFLSGWRCCSLGSNWPRTKSIRGSNGLQCPGPTRLPGLTLGPLSSEKDRKALLKTQSTHVGGEKRGGRKGPRRTRRTEGDQTSQCTQCTGKGL